MTGRDGSDAMKFRVQGTVRLVRNAVARVDPARTGRDDPLGDYESVSLAASKVLLGGESTEVALAKIDQLLAARWGVTLRDRDRKRLRREFDNARRWFGKHTPRQDADGREMGWLERALDRLLR